MEEKLPIGNEADFPITVSRMEDIGFVVQQVRKSQGMTQLDIAGLGGVGNRFIVDLEKGKKTVQMQKAMDILALLGLEIVIRKKGKS
ncbi:helix-turn-helix domain-containing protein [Herbaspirillum sp. GCM10030257]|uniref:helix-turn-helix domain-containing protein n=1 Tax=Herbaspirillum sp. GCM10030257 TaxID=3273393 RepID=UPI00361E9A4E